MDEYKFHATSQSLESARIVVKQLDDVIRLPKSILDVGCGVGGWSLAFKERGVNKISMLDHPSNKKENLLFQENDFYTVDFETNLPPVYPAELVICLEVLEHIHAHRCDAVIEYLTKCADTVLFSAAIPGQHGYKHVNENFWPYWEASFSKFGFKKYDIVRPLILFNQEIEYFIRQNIFLYVKDKGLLHTTEHEKFLPDDFEIINRKVLNRHKSPVDLIKMMPGSFKKTIGHRIGKKK
jgi:SAM-dependent methyltransferase